MDFTWTGSPAAGVQADNFSVQWMGQVQPPVSGDYVFRTESDEGVRLWVNNVLVIDHWTGHTTATDNSAPIPLVANVLYSIRLELFDGTGSATARLLWTPPGGALQVIPQVRLFPAPPLNQPPLVNAGTDQTITLPNTAQLIGTASDDGQPNPPGTLTYTWSKISGREESENVVVFSNPNSLSTTVTFPASDVYVLRLTVSDGALTSSDDVVVTVNPAPNGGGTGLQGQYFNDPNGTTHFSTLVLSRIDPTVNFDWGIGAAGPGLQLDNFSVRWTGKVQAVIAGSYVFSTSADDGVRLWINGQLVIDNWVDQPETLRDSAPITLVAGQLYDVRMEFYDHEEDAIARLMWAYPGQTRTAIPQSQLYPPTGQANRCRRSVPERIGRSRCRRARRSRAPRATTDYRILPVALALTWSKISGPGTVTFSAPSALMTNASFSIAGVYVVRLTASDGALAASDDVTVVVNPSPNLAPTVNAGPDQAITLPATVILFGTAIDDGQPNPPSIVTTTWSVVSGPGPVTFTNAAALSTSASFPTAGVYTLRLTASDGLLSSADDVVITVAAAGSGGTGLTGQYYSSVSFGSLLLTRLDPTVDFDWARGSPGTPVPTDNFSVQVDGIGASAGIGQLHLRDGLG